MSSSDIDNEDGDGANHIMSPTSHDIETVPVETKDGAALDRTHAIAFIVANNGSETMTTAPPSSLKNINLTNISNKNHDGEEIMTDDNNNEFSADNAAGSCPLHSNENHDNDRANGGNSANEKKLTNENISLNSFYSSITVGADANTNTNEILVVDTPTRRNSRLSKKRREDGFFYAQDDKREDKKMKTTTTNSELDRQHQQHRDDDDADDELSKKKKTNISCTTFANNADTSKQQQPQQKQQRGEEGGESQPPIMKQRKRASSHKCPTNDTILIQIPLSVTADLGVAMKRTRKKRIKRIKRWLRAVTTTTMQEADDGNGSDKHGEKEGDGDGSTTTSANKSSNKNDKKNGSFATINANDKTKDGSEIDHQDKEREDLGEDADEDDDDDVGNDCNNGPMNKKQYSSIVDYLEAKYVRGVMIDDYDEKVTRKMKKIKATTNAGKNNGEGGNVDEDEDSEKEGSIYSSDDGFIDDSMLNEEIVEQVMASSTYGMTRIEVEARRRKHREQKVERQGHSGALKGENDDDLSDGEEGSGSNDELGSAAASAANSDFDDGFFVNLGDLEMAEGWSGDVVITPTKNKNKKRTYNKKKTTSTSSNANKSDGKIAKKKAVQAKVAPPGGMKKKLFKDATKKTLSNKAKVKTKKKNEIDNVFGGNGNAGAGSGMVGNEHLPTMSNEREESLSSLKTKATEMIDTATNATSLKASIVTSAKPAKSKSTLPPKERMKKTMSKEKEKATHLRLFYKRRYNSCIKLIREMTNEDLPRKSKTKNTMKVSVNIPADKQIGDELTFGNPNVPGQKLKVKIPKNADMEKRRFVVSIPTPKVVEPVEIRDNNFSKAFREALFNYSNAFDEWCNAEGEHNESLPLKERKPFKPGVEKLKKFDDMAREFPKNLATPVDASFLRKLAKQERSNRSRRDKRRSGGGVSTTCTGLALVKVEPQLQESEVNVPQKGTDFPFIEFDLRDFS